ncbi:MAG TPA: energy transducer TonB [Candidatus Angelobacter sp.]|nr:energy transducer TonB [Candidatus Angelobacter sp.]
MRPQLPCSCCFRASRFALGMQSSSPNPSPTPTPANEDPKQMQECLVISGEAQQGLVLYSVIPQYPKKAQKKHIQGDVVLQVSIDKSGNVTAVKTVQGEPILADAAVKAVKQWKYKPYLLNGEPAKLEKTVNIQFHM